MLQRTKFRQSPWATKMNVIFRLILISAFAILTACGGGEETVDNLEEVEASDGTTLSVKLVNSTGATIRNLDKGSKATISATLKTASGSAWADQLIAFSADLASTDPEAGTALTGSSGIATIDVTAGNVAGAGKVYASITLPSNETITAEFGYSVGASGVPNQGPKNTNLSLKLLDNSGNEIRQLERNAEAKIEAIITDTDGNALVNQVVKFTADLSSLASEAGTKLTDANGKATMDLKAGSKIGAGYITASITVNSEPFEVQYGYEILGGTDSSPNPNPETPGESNVSNSVTGAIEFVSALPNKIALRNTGGEGLSEFSTVTFRLVGTDGLPMAGKTVNFSLSKTTNIGGLDIDPMTAVTNSEGLVSTTLQAGSVATTVSVKALTVLQDIDGNDKEVFTYSDSLSVSTGRPDQDSMSLSFSTYNPEAWNYDGVEVDVTIRLGDHYNNWVPDGTTVYFTAEGGSIEPSCRTENNACSVKWMSQAPRPTDHRVTILAHTLGNESFKDTDSDGLYTLADGEPWFDLNHNMIFDEPFVDANNNGIFDEPFTPTGNGRWDEGEAWEDVPNGRYDFGESFTDLPDGKWSAGEVFTDTSGNGQYDLGEPFVDSLGNGRWDAGEPYIDAKNGRYDYGEAFTDVPVNFYQLGNVFKDYNNNGVYDGNGDNPEGESSFTDLNANGEYDGSGQLSDGEAQSYTELTGNTHFDGPGFADLGEPFLDANENRAYDFGELYFDTNNDGQFNALGDGRYNGILCNEVNVCSDKEMIQIRDQAVLVMSGSHAKIVVKDLVEDIVYYSNAHNVASSGKVVDIAGGASRYLIAYITDDASQTMPEETTFDVSSDVGKLSGETSHKVPSNNLPFYGRVPGNNDRAYEGWYFIIFTLTDSDPAKFEPGTLTIDITTPKGNSTVAPIGVRS